MTKAESRFNPEFIRDTSDLNSISNLYDIYTGYSRKITILEKMTVLKQLQQDKLEGLFWEYPPQ